MKLAIIFGPFSLLALGVILLLLLPFPTKYTFGWLL